MTGNELRELREARGWSQDQLAQLLNDSLGKKYSSSTISQWETEKRPVVKGVAAFLESLAIEDALPLRDHTEPSPLEQDEPPGPGRESPAPRDGSVLAGNTYARICTELFEMVATGLSIMGAAIGNERLLIDGLIIDADKQALGRAYGRLAETNDTFRKMLTGATTSGCWLEIAMVSAATSSKLLRNHMQGGESGTVPAVASEPESPPQPTPVVF